MVEPQSGRNEVNREVSLPGIAAGKFPLAAGLT